MHRDASRRRRRRLGHADARRRAARRSRTRCAARSRLELERPRPGHDLHSGQFGGAVANPLEALCAILAQLFTTRDGAIAIPGFYDRRARARGAPSARACARAGPSDAEFSPTRGRAAAAGERRLQRSTSARRSRPTLTSPASPAATPGPGVKAVIPAGAAAKLSLRLVPDQDPAHASPLIRGHVAALRRPAWPAFASSRRRARATVDRRHPALQRSRSARTRGPSAASPALPALWRDRSPSSALLQELLGVPIVLWVSAFPSDAHARAERAHHLPTLARAIATCVWFLEARCGAGDAANGRREHRHDRRLPLPRRPRRRAHRARGTPRARLDRYLAARRACRHRRAPSSSRRSIPTTRSPTARSRGSSPATRAASAASRSCTPCATAAGSPRSSARPWRYGFRGIKVHRHDARITREICEVGARFALPVLYDVMGEVSVVELLAREYPDVDFIIPHLGSFADDWRAQLALIDHLARHPNVYTDTSGVRRFDLLEEAVARAGPRQGAVRLRRTVAAPGVELAKMRLLGLAPADERLVLGRQPPASHRPRGRAPRARPPRHACARRRYRRRPIRGRSLSSRSTRRLADRGWAALRRRAAQLQRARRDPEPLRRALQVAALVARARRGPRRRRRRRRSPRRPRPAPAPAGSLLESPSPRQSLGDASARPLLARGRRRPSSGPGRRGGS